jgi:hypothetical protein
MPDNSESVPSTHSFLALVFVSTLFAGYIILPAAFPQPRTKDEYTGCIEYPEYWDCPGDYVDTEPEIIQLPLLLYLSALACSTGVLGCLCLWWKYQRNYKWLMKRTLMPALCNSCAGLWSALVIANDAEKRGYSRTMRVAMVAPSAGSVVAAGLGLGYYAVMSWLSKRGQDVKPAALERGKKNRQDEDS